MASHSIKLLSFHSPLPKPFLIPQTHSFPKPLNTHHSSLKIQSSSQTQPPSSREEAVLQAKTCLSSTLRKPLNNPTPLPRLKLRKQRQPRFRVEIPVADDSPESVSNVAVEVFSDLPITKKGEKHLVLVLFCGAHQVFVESPNVVCSQLASVDVGDLSSADLAVFVAPEVGDIEELRRVCEGFGPKPVVLFNPKWGFEDENSLEKQLAGFVASFDVVYSFMGLEVRGILSRRKGVVLRCVKDGVLSGEEWLVFVEGESNDEEMKVVSRFKRRPAIGDVESVLYNFMAANSPVTKSVKFIRDLASNVTGKKDGQ